MLVEILFGGCSANYQMEKTTTYPDGRIVVEKPIETFGFGAVYFAPRYPYHGYQQPYSYHHQSIRFHYSVGKGLKIYSQSPAHHNKVSRNRGMRRERR